MWIRSQCLSNRPCKARIRYLDACGGRFGRTDILIKQISQAEIRWVHLINIFQACPDSKDVRSDVGSVRQEVERQASLDIECPALQVRRHVGLPIYPCNRTTIVLRGVKVRHCDIRCREALIEN